MPMAEAPTVNETWTCPHCGDDSKEFAKPYHVNAHIRKAHPNKAPIVASKSEEEKRHIPVSIPDADPEIAEFLNRVIHQIEQGKGHRPSISEVANALYGEMNDSIVGPIDCGAYEGKTLPQIKADALLGFEHILDIPRPLISSGFKRAVEGCLDRTWPCLRRSFIRGIYDDQLLNDVVPTNKETTRRNILKHNRIMLAHDVLATMQAERILGSSSIE
jgi:hypothetical protein